MPENEPGRLAALASMAILDTEREELYDDTVRLAAALCRTPIAMINLVDGSRQWGKAVLGLETVEWPRAVSFCARTIVSDTGVLVVPDTLEDPEWSTNPMVVGDPRLRFYAGAAIVTSDGFAVGSVCVADRAAREIVPEELAALRILARQTAAHLELRRQSALLASANRELHRLAVRDPLTGLANRSLLLEHLGQALAVRRRSGAGLAVSFCDVDGLKAVNDRLGHDAGDELLVMVGHRLAAAARESDCVARLAGDEFVIVHPDVTSVLAAEAVARRLTRDVGRPASIGGETISPRLSVGGALARDGDTEADLLRRGDVAMYAVKRRQTTGS